MLEGEQASFAKEVARLVHDHQFRKASQYVSDACQLNLKIGSDKPAEYLPPLQTYLHWLLNNNARLEAAELLWTPNQFSPKPKSTRAVWDLLDTSSTSLIMGGASMSKSFGAGVYFFLEWIRDPLWTTVRVIGPSEDHLETNLFSHIVSLHRDASLPMPGEVGDLYIGMDRRDLKSSIKGVVIPVGKVKKAGRLQGTKRKPRPEVHPIFGELSRLFIFIDELENVPGGLWSDIDNILSNLDQVDSQGLKIGGAYNPSDRTSEVGKRAEPEKGWEAFDIENDYRWTSKRGWEILRLDGEKSENVIANKIIFPGIQSRTGLERIAKNAGGRESGGYLTMGRGAYPSASLAMSIIPAGMAEGMRGEFIWFEPPSPIGGADLALEGGAKIPFSLGDLGMATGIKWPPSIKHPQGHTEMFKNPQGFVIPRWGLQLKEQFTLPKGDTVAVSKSLIELARRAGIKAENLCLDRTGNGAGVHDLTKNNWSPAVIGVNYSSGPTEMKITQEDQKIAKDEFDRIDSELWFALRAWAEFHFILIHPSVDMSKLTQQITQRHYRVANGKRKVESKADYKSRGFESPDEADSLTLLVHAARVGSKIIPSMADNTGSGPDSDGWWEGNLNEGGVVIDPSNQTDSLDV